MAQSVERRIGSAEVTGPIPVSSWIAETETLVEKVSVFFCKGYAAHKAASIQGCAAKLSWGGG